MDDLQWATVVSGFNWYRLWLSLEQYWFGSPDAPLIYTVAGRGRLRAADDAILYVFINYHIPYITRTFDKSDKSDRYKEAYIITYGLQYDRFVT